MTLRSRISGRACASVPKDVVPALFEAGDPPTRLVPGGVEVGAPVSFLGRAPEEADAKAIERIVSPLEGAPWSAWLEASPLVPQIGEQAHLDVLEREIRKQLPDLAHVCHHPRLRLRVDEERVPVTLARRIPLRAVASLVAHPRDWENRTLRNIRPARVLAARIEDDWDLYENRVAAKLVEHLLKRVGDRLERLRRLAEMDQEARDFAGDTRGSLWRARRLFTVWGRAVSGDTLRDVLSHTLAELERIQNGLQALLDSPLYRNTPRGTFVPVMLRPTNILVNDPYYRKVAALWRAWVKHGHQTPRSRTERQVDCARFDSFALLLTVHSLANLGYVPGGDPPLPGDGALDLIGPLGLARLRSGNGVLHVEIGSASLRLVPVLSTVDPRSATALWQEVRRESEGVKETVVVLLLGRPADADGAVPAAARAFAGWERPRIVLLSPWSLDCAERLSRVLRQAEAAVRFAEYPPRALVRADPGIGLPPWMQRAGSDVAVLSPAPPKDVAKFAQMCADKEAALRREEKDGKWSGRTPDPGLLRAVEDLRRLAERASELVPWRTCPVCENDAGNDFEGRPASGEDWGRWGFWCRCARCDAAWGLRPCTSCGRSFPVLVMSQSSPLGEEETMSPMWIDRRHGRDLWTEPCWRPGAESTFRCTHCGACPGGGCSRCSVAQHQGRRENIGGAGR